MALRQKISTKIKLSQTLKSWLPILQSPTSELEEIVSKMSEDNPCINIKSGFEIGLNEAGKIKKKRDDFKSAKNSNVDKIESLSIYEEGLLDVLYAQIKSPIFPTYKSQAIARKIIDNLDENGFFIKNYEDIIDELGDIFLHDNLDENIKEIEKVRARFYNLEPCGIGAINIIESLSFQLLDSNLENEDYDIALKIIENLENHAKYKKYKDYEKIMNVIKKFRQFPSIDYKIDSNLVISDIIILQEGNNIELQINDSFYPSIALQNPTLKSANQDTFFKDKIKEAKDLIDALEMRKATIRKIGLMIIEYQYDFFMGGEIKPMRLKDIAQELNHATSTISRAIANKFLECSRGVFPIKSFFTTAIDGDTSNSSIKDCLLELIKNENKMKPLSDIKILEIIESKFNLKMVRRTITKYRKQLDIPSSSDRKRLYEISL